MASEPYEIPRPIIDENDIVTESSVEYIPRAKPVLRCMPDDVIDQWLYSHPQVIDDWNWLDLASLQFSLEEWRVSDVPAVDQDADSAVHTYRYNLDRTEPSMRSMRVRRLVEYFEANQTWPRSPIFLENLQGQHVRLDGWKCSEPYQLLEGHHRMAVFSLFRDQGRLRETHQVWVAKNSTS